MKLNEKLESIKIKCIRYLRCKIDNKSNKKANF